MVLSEQDKLKQFTGLETLGTIETRNCFNGAEMKDSFSCQKSIGDKTERFFHIFKLLV